MSRDHITGARLIAFGMMCILLCLAILPGSCMECGDGGAILLQTAQAHHLDRTTASAPDQCTGLCSCCASQLATCPAQCLPVSRRDEPVAAAAEPSASLALRVSPFRPPRLA